MSVSANTAPMFSPGSQNRALAQCVALSLLLHALVLALPGLRPGAPAPASARILTATFAPRAAPSEPAPPEPQKKERSEPEQPVPKPEARLQTEPPRPVPATPAPAASRTTDAPGPPATSAEPAVGAPPGGAAAPGPPRQVDAPPAAAASGAGAARADSDADAGTLDQYRLALIFAAKRYKRYPAQAMDKGWQGKVEVRLVIGPNGAIQSSLVKASSGYEILDNQALDMIKKAKPLTPIPAALRGREFTVDIPVIFDLQAG